MKKNDNRITRLQFKVFLYFILVVLVAVFFLYSARTVIGSPQGKIVYAKEVDSKQYTTHGGRYDLFMRKLPNGKEIRLTTNGIKKYKSLGGAIREPKWSPNGKWIVFLSNPSNANSNELETYTDASPYPYSLLTLWLLNPTKGNVTQISNGDLGWQKHVWSPNSKRIAAVYPSRSGVVDQDIPIPDQILIIDPFKSKIIVDKRVAGMVGNLYWSKDSKKIFFTLQQKMNLYVLDLLNKKISIVNKHYRINADSIISPDGYKTIFIKNKSLYSKDNKNKSTKKLITDIESISNRWWSNDGQWLILKNFNTTGTGLSEELLSLDISTGNHKYIFKLGTNTNGIDWHEL